MNWVILALSAGLMSGPDGAADLEASLTVVSDYRSRGLSSSEEGLAVQGEVALTGAGGGYLGAWVSSLEPSGDARSEVNLYAGYGRAMAGFDLDISVTAFAFPGQEDTLYSELVLAASRAFGPASATAGFAYAPAQDNLEAENSYWFVESETLLGDTGLSLIGAVGLEDGSLGDLAEDGGEKWDWTLGVAGAFDSFSWSLAYMDSTEDTDLSDAHLVLSLERAF